MDVHRQKLKAIKRNPTRRGRGVKSKKGENNVKFSLLGNNANGLKAKLKSLKTAIHFFKNPSCITIQESNQT